MNAEVPPPWLNMEPEDPNLTVFLDAVCQYMETWYSCGDGIEDFRLDDLCEEPYSDFKKHLKLFYLALNPLHKDWFNNFFTLDTIEWNYVHSLLSAHCYAMVNKCKSEKIFICLMYVCSFTYSLLDFCEKKALSGRLRQIKPLIKDVFIKQLKDRFIYKGGWAGLRVYCQREHLPKMLQFISECYCELSYPTYVIRDQKLFKFGYHGKDTISLLLNKVPKLELSVLEAFEYNFMVNSQYEQEVRTAFSKLRSNLEKASAHNYLAEYLRRLSV